MISRSKLRESACLALPIPVAIAEMYIIPPVHLGPTVAAAVGIGALLFRYRWPRLVLVVTLIGLTFTNMVVPNMVALYTVASRPTRRAVLIAVGLLTAIALAVHWPWAEPTYLLDLSDPHNVRILLLRIVLMVAGPIALGFLVQTRRALEISLAEIVRGREREQQLLSETVRGRERAQLARELHDTVADKVSLIAVQAGGMRATAPTEQVAAWADSVRALCVATLTELRQQVTVLRAAGAEYPGPGLTEIPDLVSNSGIDAELVLDERLLRAEWPESVQRAVFRTVQEALTNIRKHAPGARVRVEIDLRDTDVAVSVRNGPALTPSGDTVLPDGGHGLIGLAERAELLHGTFTAQATDGGGFHLRATFPGKG